MPDKNEAAQQGLLEFTTKAPDEPDGARLNAAIEQSEPSTLNLFVTPGDLFAATDWGDVLRVANAHFDDLRLVIDQESRWALLLWNPGTGMWRQQGNPGFTALFDHALAEANETALRLAEEDPTLEARVVPRLRRHIDRTSASSVSRAIKRSARLAEDPCVPIMRVHAADLNPVGQHPLLACENGVVRLTDGKLTSPQDVKSLHLLDIPPCPTAFDPEAHERDVPGAVAMRQFLRYLGAGDEWTLARRLGWQLCGHHDTIDTIAGDERALYLLARALSDILGPGGARLLSMDRGDVRTRDAAHAMEQARLCLWPGADNCKQFPMWGLNGLLSRVEARRQGNLVLLVSDWPADVESLDHRMARRFAWAFKAPGSLRQHDIEPEVLLDRRGRECLLAMLIEGAGHSIRQFDDTKVSAGIGDPSQVAATDYTRACAEELRLAGAHPIHRTLYRALRFTDDPSDAMTLADVDEAIEAAGEQKLSHYVVGKEMRRMWPDAESGRDRIDGVQTRVLRRVAPRTDHPNSDW